ncbi:hypothetical protein SAMN05444920_109298 [Nonomuraea solani]|uniref:DUF1707 domain-containing protein n=1 Tax=Nonomuraea solani TaxID=1144553 RepID=A0A1H6EEF8_9ACTN|nr:DUF1707 domain-containing protein [Nonomuraea solani]SEG96162.1 hypothetical protein SAMN05444920_109298 [Nonomuraea solani]
MSGSENAGMLLRRLLSPERTPVTQAERRAADGWIDRAKFGGKITEGQAEERRARLATAKTRADLRVALTGLPGAEATTLPRLLSVVTLVWLGACLVQIAVWLMIVLFGGGFAELWWLWTVVVGGAVVGVLWSLAEGQYRAWVAGDLR